MIRMPRVTVLLCLAIAFTLIPRAVRADPRTSYLADQLKSNDDYRVRTQAALALGASGDDAAVQPLCDALGDSNPSVKVAAAAALGKLAKPAGVPCLQSASKRESTASVKSQIDKSIASLQGGGSSGSGAAAPPPPDARTRVYVAIQVTNKTSRGASDVDALIRAAMQDKLLAKAGYAVAPKSETPAQGGPIVKSKKLKGFFLIATVEAPIYEGGNLSQTVRISMWSYPEKALQGEFAPKLTQSGTPKKDVESEDALMKLCVENAIESFQKVVASL
jgi:HEAT repeat protein